MNSSVKKQHRDNKKEAINEREIDKYTKTVNSMTKNTVRQTIDLISNTDEETFKVLIGMAINKILEFPSESGSVLNEYLPYILNASKAFENPTSILFLLLENLSQKKDEVARLKILEILSKHHFTVSNIINMLYKEDTHSVALEILRINEDLIDEFIKTSIIIDNPTVTKNISAILPCLNPKYFVSYNSFLSLFESENHHMRNCLLDIFQVLILSFKEQENIEAIRELIDLVSERLYDVNFYVRSKALGVIGDLFRRECILKDQRNHLIGEIIERTKDKTVIVRKKSIGLLTQILINHPFKDRRFLEKSENTPKNLAEAQRRMQEDFDEFVELMESCLETIVGLLDYNLKTDLCEISDFIKTAYLLKLKGSKEAIQKILGTVFTKDKDTIIEIFKEILTKRGEILYEFINDKAFEAILGCLDIDEKILYKNIFNQQKVFESIYILRQSQKGLSESNGLSLLQFVTDILFRSKDESDLRQNIDMYVNTLCILKNISSRIEHNSEVFTLAIKNVIKMVFFERSVIKNTVEMIYCTSINPEMTVGKMLKSLCLTKSTLKIVDAVGSVALNQYYLLERLERSLRSQKSGIEVNLSTRVSLESIREKRKSLEDTRRVSLSRMSIDKSSNKGGWRLSLNFEDLQESLKDKADEEIADFFFYLKEREILYSPDSMLHQFIPILIDSLQSGNPEIQATAYSSVFKCMLVSSEFFNEHRHVIKDALDSPIMAVKNNAIAAIHDFMIFYNTSMDTALLFDKLTDKEVNKNVILVIFDLLQKNIIRLKNNSTQLASLLFDEHLGSIVKTLLRNLSSNNNIISSIFYDSFVSELNVETVRYLAGLIAPTIQEALFLKCMKNGADTERLKAVFEVFKLNEKFIKENMFREEMKQILGAETH